MVVLRASQHLRRHSKYILCDYYIMLLSPRHRRSCVIALHRRNTLIEQMEGSAHSSLVQFEPKCDNGQYVHCDDDAAHQINIIIGIEFVDANFLQECDGFFEMAVFHWCIVWAI